MEVSPAKVSQAEPILMIHGMVEDGRIFYHKSGKGLASYLAKQGYQVFVADLRGVGKSTPAINENSHHGQSETVQHDIPAIIEFIKEKCAHQQLHLVAHSWGGVYLNACLLRYPEIAKTIKSAAYFGSKRRIRVRNLSRLFMIELMWKRVGLLISHAKGYFPAIALKAGSQNESKKTHQQCVDWIRQDHWIDSDYNFDYHQAAKNHHLPPILYFAAINDSCLGHRDDVKLFIDECSSTNYKYQLLSKANGNTIDYGHLDMLTAKEAYDDHFPDVIEWFKQGSAARTLE